MNTNYETDFEGPPGAPADREMADREMTDREMTDRELTDALGLLAASGVGAELAYSGDADGCPHCAWRVLSEAA
jgi:hypothetical protein